MAKLEARSLVGKGNLRRFGFPAAIPQTLLPSIRNAQKLPERRTTGRKMIQLDPDSVAAPALFNLGAAGVKEAIMDRKKVVRYVLIALGVLIVILLALPLFINANSFSSNDRREALAALGRKVQVGDLSLSIFSGSLTASNLSIADDPAFSASLFLTAKTFHVGVEVWLLLTSKTLNVTSLTIENPELNLVRNLSVAILEGSPHTKSSQCRGLEGVLL